MAGQDFERILQEQRLSEQHIQNFTFDKEFGLLIVELAGYDLSTDTMKRVAVDSSGKLLVNIGAVESIWPWAEILTIANNALTTILSYTVATSDLLLDNVIASGTVDAEYRLVIDGSTKAKYRTSEQDRTAKFLFPVAQKVAVGSTVQVKVIHYNTNTADFDAAIIGHK